MNGCENFGCSLGNVGKPSTPKFNILPREAKIDLSKSKEEIDATIEKYSKAPTITKVIDKKGQTIKTLKNW